MPVDETVVHGLDEERPDESVTIYFVKGTSGEPISPPTKAKTMKGAMRRYLEYLEHATVEGIFATITIVWPATGDKILSTTVHGHNEDSRLRAGAAGAFDALIERKDVIKYLEDRSIAREQSSGDQQPDDPDDAEGWLEYRERKECRFSQRDVEEKIAEVLRTAAQDVMGL